VVSNSSLEGGLSLHQTEYIQGKPKFMCYDNHKWLYCCNKEIERLYILLETINFEKFNLCAV
jgi:hypothetical protein